MRMEHGGYARFWALLKRMPGADKDTLVEQFTNGRTTHLHGMSADEYGRMCDTMSFVAGYDERKASLYRETKRMRSMALHLMGQWGVPTGDWEKVNYFCMRPRIARKEFRQLTLDELSSLCRKLRMMIKKREEKQENS